MWSTSLQDQAYNFARHIGGNKHLAVVLERAEAGIYLTKLSVHVLDSVRSASVQGSQ